MPKEIISNKLKEINKIEKEIAEIKERLKKLERAVFLGGADTSGVLTNAYVDYSLDERAFIKKYLSGFNRQKFFTLILAYLAEGKEAVPINLSQIKTVWKNCAGIVGVPYASIFSTRAKEVGWVDASKQVRASYVLGKHWKEIFNKL